MSNRTDQTDQLADPPQTDQMKTGTGKGKGVEPFKPTRMEGSELADLEQVR